MSALSDSTLGERATSVVRVLALKHAFSEDVVECRLAPGKTLREIVGNCGDGLVITVDGNPVPARFWPHLRPKAGTLITVAAIPHGPNAKTLILTLGLIAGAFFAGPAVAGFFAQGSFFANAAIWQGAVYAVGSLLVNALIKPPVVTPDAQARKLQNVTGTRNDFRPFEA